MAETAKPVISQEEKITSLKGSIRAAHIVMPVLIVVVIGFYFSGFVISFPKLFAIFCFAYTAILLQQYFIGRKWFIDLLYGFLFDLLVSIMILVGIYETGAIVSPFIWLGLFTAVFATVGYGFQRGMIEALVYLAYIWLLVELEMSGVILYVPFIPGFQVFKDHRFILSMLIGYSLLFIAIPFTAGLLSQQLRAERKRAVELFDEREKIFRSNLSVLEDLEKSHAQLKAQLQELDASKKEALDLLKLAEEEKVVAQKREEEIKRLYEDMKVVDRMKTEFLSVISHELRTPITPIKGYASLLLSDSFGALNDKQKKAVGVMAKEGEHLLELIDGILDVTRLERGKPLAITKEPVSMPVLVKELLVVYEPQYTAQQISVEMDFPENFSTILADPGKLHRLLTNLLGNALKFTPKDGKIRIVGLSRENEIEVQVIDNGMGIAKENIGKLFQRFYQVDSSYTRSAGGVGLGLAISKEIVDVHGGKIWAESEGLGMGMKIAFTLPIKS